MRIADDGKGIDTADAGSPALGVGIPGMEARIHQVGGRLTVTSNPRGTSVQATIPLADGQDGAGPQA